MIREYIRIKRNIKIFEEDNDLLFIGSYGKAVRIQKPATFNNFLELLIQTKSRDKIVSYYDSKEKGAGELAGLLLDKLLDAGLLEYFSFHELESPAYIRYQTQLSFFDLMQPAKSVSEQMRWQQTLSDLHVMVIGCGGIGCAVLQSLVSMGIGRISVVDNDCVELSNLNRQMLFSENDLGKFKVEVVAEKLKLLNSACTIMPIMQEIEDQQHIRDYIHASPERPDLIFLCADNPPDLPVWLNEVCDEFHVPFIKSSYQGLTGFIGPLVVPGGTKYQDIVGIDTDGHAQGMVTAHNMMIKHASFIAGNSIIANMSVMEATKYLLGLPGITVLERRLFINMQNLTFI